jgi:cyclopropane fatty-acyl-phospholipid synthase-like methyltransferase
VIQPGSPAALRNRDPILQVLQREFRDRRSVLEIGSGTGQHAVYMAEHMPGLVWQASDRAENLPGILAWFDEVQLANLRAPLQFDVESDADPDGPFDAIFSANTAHIMRRSAVEQMFGAAGRVLPEDGRFCLYGPFKLKGEFTSDSNAAFDRSLQSQGAGMGIRELEWLDELALDGGMRRHALFAMPANNFVAVWRKIATLWA